MPMESENPYAPPSASLAADPGSEPHPDASALRAANHDAEGAVRLLGGTLAVIGAGGVMFEALTVIPGLVTKEAMGPAAIPILLVGTCLIAIGGELRRFHPWARRATFAGIALAFVLIAALAALNGAGASVAVALGISCLVFPAGPVVLFLVTRPVAAIFTPAYQDALARTIPDWPKPARLTRILLIVAAVTLAGIALGELLRALPKA